MFDALSAILLAARIVFIAVLAIAVFAGTPWLVYALAWAGPRARLYRIAARNLVQHRRRTLLLGGATAGVTAALIVMLALAAGVRRSMLVSATTLMTGHVNVAGFFKITAGLGVPLLTEYPPLLELVEKAIPEELDYAAPRGRGYAKLVSDTSSAQVALAGIDVASEPNFREVVQIADGDIDALRQKNALLIFEGQAKRLDVKVGDQVTVIAGTLRGVSNTVDARIVAIAREIGLMSQFSAFMDVKSLSEMYRLKDTTTGAIHVYLKDIEKAQQAAAKLRAALAEAGYTVMDPDPQAYFLKIGKVNRQAWTGQRIDVTSWEDEIAFVRWVVSALDIVIYILTLILMAIIAVGIMNTLWISVRERTREIGTLRAIGMQRRYVIATFVIEAFTLSIASTLVGALAGIATCALVGAMHVRMPLPMQLFLMSETFTFWVQPPSVLGSIALITYCTTLVALVPSYLAARMKPITAMHHIG